MQKELNDKFADDENYHLVQDQCHYTGKCRDSSHSIRNLIYGRSK